MESGSDPFRDFDEEAYLAANPDVREAVLTGAIASGLDHYLQWGQHERRPGFRSAVKRPTSNRRAYRPIDATPPEALQTRVSGVADRAIFEQVGRSVCDDILDTMATHQIDLTSDAMVLDFGCGCGRVLRHFAPQCSAKIDGVDIDAEAIKWCQANLAGAATFHCSPEWPPLPFEDARFDFVYSVSVFTHLPKEMQLAWLTELRRVAKPGAWLLISIHAPELMPTNNLAAAEQMAEHGFAYLRGDATAGLPDFYRTAYHAESYIRQEWGKLFQIENVIKEGINRHQDLVVARMPSIITDDAHQTSLGHNGIINGWSRKGQPAFDFLFKLRCLFSKRSEERVALTTLPKISSWQAKVNEVWSTSPEEKSAAQGWYWMAHPMVRERVNNLISGNQWLDAYGRLGVWLEENDRVVPLGRSISLGCGFGGLERDLTRRGMIREIDAYDLAQGAVVEAQRLAEEAGHGCIRYHVADLEVLAFPKDHYDAAFAHSSVHHVEHLERLFATVHQALRPGGIFHLNEYVGPSRFQWTDAQMQLINDYLHSLPDWLRQTPNGLKPPVERPTIDQMVAVDPTEAVRSADIREVLSRHFRIVEERLYGGTLLHMGLAEIAQNFDATNSEAVAHLQRFFDLEDAMMANGTIGSDFIVITAVRE